MIGNASSETNWNREYFIGRGKGASLYGGGGGVWVHASPEKLHSTRKTPFPTLSGWKVLKIDRYFLLNFYKNSVVTIWRHVKTKNTAVTVLLVMTVLMGN